MILAPSILLAEKVQDLPKPTAYVTDTAGVLSESTQIEINQICGEVERQAHAQIAVVIIKSLEDRPIDDFANDLSHTWKIGINNAQQGRDRGVLLLFATQDRKRRIEVGYGLEGILPDAKAGDIGRAMVPYLRQNQWDEAVKLGVNQVGQVIADDAGVQLQTIQPAHRYRRENVPQKLGAGGYIVGILVLLFILFVIFAIIRSIFRRGGGGPGSGGGLGWLPWFLLGNLLGGGGRGWGDSDRRGGGGWGGDSGGDSGGGFGGFGGGDSGGGGASGDW